jgi:hypothetical protein
MGSSYNSRCVATSYYAKEFNQRFSYNRLKKKHEERKRKISGLMNADTNTPLKKMKIILAISASTKINMCSEKVFVDLKEASG